jgi:hypothetical protein
MGVSWELFGDEDGRVVVVVDEDVGLEQAPRTSALPATTTRNAIHRHRGGFGAH